MSLRWRKNRVSQSSPFHGLIMSREQHFKAWHYTGSFFSRTQKLWFQKQMKGKKWLWNKALPTCIFLVPRVQTKGPYALTLLHAGKKAFPNHLWNFSSYTVNLELASRQRPEPHFETLNNFKKIFWISILLLSLNLFLWRFNNGPSFFFSCSFVLNPKGALSVQSKIQSSKRSEKIKTI